MFFVLFFSCLLLLFSFYKQIYFEHKISIEKNKEKKKKYCVLLDFLRLPGAMIVTDHLLQESFQRRIDSNTIRIKSYFKWHHKIKWNPFNPFNPHSFHHWVFSNTDLSDSTDAYWGIGTVFQTALLGVRIIPRLRHGLLSLRSVLSSRQRWLYPDL